MNTSKVNVSPLYLQLIQDLHDEKIAVNERKIARWGYLNVDDHGFIDFPEFTFEPEVNEEGKVFGGALLGKNMRRFLNEAPKYINPSSALATCWPGDIGKFMPLGIAEADKMVEELPIWEKYDIHQSGYLAMKIGRAHV